MESRHIPINSRENKLWKYLQAVAKEDLKDFREYLSVDKISYPELIHQLQQWHMMC